MQNRCRSALARKVGAPDRQWGGCRMLAPHGMGIRKAVQQQDHPAGARTCTGDIERNAVRPDDFLVQLYGAQADSQAGFLVRPALASAAPISPTMPRRNNNTQAMKISPVTMPTDSPRVLNHSTPVWVAR